MRKMLQQFKKMFRRGPEPKSHNLLRPIDPQWVGDITSIAGVEQLKAAQKEKEGTHA